MGKGKILYIRSGPYELSFDSYNLQEVGLGKAFCATGYDFDIVYYTKKRNHNQMIDTPHNQLRILWRKGIKLLRSGVYPKILEKRFLNKYDAVIISEYSQIMSVLVSGRHPNTYIYNGPYYNLFKIPLMEKMYDALYAKYLNKHIRKVFCKTQMAKDYIARKGITNSIVVGVGLDLDKFEAEQHVEAATHELIEKMEGKKNLLYVGQIIPRKNVELLIKAFLEIKNEKKNIQLVLVGSGDSEYKKKCEALIPEAVKDSVIWCSFIKNAQLKYVYEKASVFLLPSTQEIFGMVMLEAMYFGLPVISSKSAGAITLIKNGINGIIVNTYLEHDWVSAIDGLILNEERSASLGIEASKEIKEEFVWSVIAKKMICEMQK